MKQLSIILLSVFSFTAIHAQPVKEKYNSAFAKKLPADEYGMKNYVFVLLKPGSNTLVDKTTEDSLFHGHMNN